MPAAVRTYAAAVDHRRTEAALNTKRGDVRTPRVPKSAAERKETRALQKIFSAREARNGSALKISIAREQANMKRMQHDAESIQPAAAEPVRTVKAKQRKEERLIMPSINSAMRPAYSLASAPNDARKSGAENASISYIMSAVSFSSCILKRDTEQHYTLYQRSDIKSEIVIERRSACRSENP